MDVLRPLSTGVSTSGGSAEARGSPLRVMHQHPGSILLYLIKTTNTPSTLNQHPFVPIEYRVSIRIAARQGTRQWRDLFDGGSPRSWGAEGGRGRRNSRRSREMLLMPRDKHVRETSSWRFVPVFVSSRPVRETNDERRWSVVEKPMLRYK